MILYRVKWKGYDETTWEPATSFEDENILREYNKRVGLTRAGSDDSTDQEMLEVA